MDGFIVVLAHHQVVSLAPKWGAVLEATRRENQLAERVKGAIRLYRLVEGEKMKRWVKEEEEKKRNLTRSQHMF